MCPHVTRSSTGWNHQPIITKDQHQTTTYNNCNNFPKASTSIGTAWRLVFEGLARLAPTNPTNPRGKKSAPRCTIGDHRVPLGSLQHGPQSRFPDQWSPNSMQSPHPNLVAAAKGLTRILVSWCFVCFMGFMPTYGKYPRIWFRYDSDMIQFAVDAVDAADGASLIAQHYGIPQPEGRVATWCHHFTRFTSSTPVPRDTCWRAAYPQRVWADAPLRRSRRSLLHQSPDPRRQTGFIRLPICWYLTLFYMQKRVHMLCMICIHIRVRHVCVFAVWWSIFQYRGQVWGFTISIKTLQCGAFHVFSQKKTKSKVKSQWWPSPWQNRTNKYQYFTNIANTCHIIFIAFSLGPGCILQRVHRSGLDLLAPHPSKTQWRRNGASGLRGPEVGPDVKGM